MSTYYVNPSSGSDGNPGTIGSPWRTINYAKSNVSAGDIVNLRSGSYGSATWSGSNDKGTSGNHITFQGYAGDSAHSALFGNVEFTGNYDWYVDIKDVEIYTTSGIGVFYVNSNSAYVTVSGCKIHGDPGGGEQARDAIVYLNNTHHCIIDNCEVYYPGSTSGSSNRYDAYMLSIEESDYTTVRYSHFHDGIRSAIKISDGYCNYTLIEYNIIHEQRIDWKSSAHGSGITVRASYVTIRGNIIYNYGNTRPIRTYQFADSGPTGNVMSGYVDILIENNLIYCVQDEYVHPSTMWWVEFKELGVNFVFRNNTIGDYYRSWDGDCGLASGLELSCNQYSYTSTWKVYNNVIERYWKNWFPLSYASNIDEGNNFIGQLWVDSSRYYDATNVWPGSGSRVGGSFAEGVFFEEKEQNWPYGSVYPFELCSGSPAINFGDTSEAPTLDLLERSRVGQADAGCFEFEGGGPTGDTKTFSVGVALQDTLLTKTFTVGSQVMKRSTKTFTAGARLEALTAVAFSINGVLHKAGQTKTFTVVSKLVRRLTKDTTVNVLLGRIKAFSMNAQLTSPELYDTLWIDFTSDKLFWIDGQFTSTVNDSQTISSITDQPRGISATTTDDILWCEGGDEGSDKLHLQSGRFTSTVKDSMSITSWNTRPQDCALDVNGDIVWCGDGEDGYESKLYLQSGLFTSTLKTSQDVTNSIVGCSVDINGNVPWCNSATSKLYLTSGEFSSTIKTSLNISSIETGPRCISWNGLGETLVGGIQADKLYKFSGQFTTTLHDSESIAVASPQGIDTTDWFTRLYGAPTLQTKTFAVDAVLLEANGYVKEFAVDAQIVNRVAKTFSANSYILNRLTKTVTTSAELVNLEIKECTADVYLIHALNLVTNGHFSFWTADDPDDWTVYISGGEDGSNYIEEDDKKCHYVAAGGVTVTMKQAGILRAYGRYLIRLNVISITGILIVWGGGDSTEIDSTGQKEFTITCGDIDTDFLFSFDSSCDTVFDNIEVYSIGKTFELDSRLVDRSTKECTAGSRVINRSTKECTAGARLGGIKTLTAGARLTELATKTFEINTVLQQVLTKDCAVDAALLPPPLTKECTADGYLVDRITKTFAVDSAVVGRFTKAVLIDAGLVRLLTCTAGAYLVDRFVQTLTVSAYLVGKKTFTVGAKLVNLLTKECTTGAYLIRKKELLVGYQLVSRQTAELSLGSRLMDRYTKECTIGGQIDVQPVKPTIIGALVIDRSILAVTINTKVVVRNTVTLTGNARLGGIKVYTADAHLSTESTKTAMAILVLESSLNIDQPVDLFQSKH